MPGVDVAPFRVDHEPSDCGFGREGMSRRIAFFKMVSIVRGANIVRRELGSINRAVYAIAFLHEPGTPLPTPWYPAATAWNGRLIYSFGGGVQANYHMGRALGAMTGTEGKLFMEDLGAGFLGIG